MLENYGWRAINRSACWAQLVSSYNSHARQHMTEEWALSQGTEGSAKSCGKCCSSSNWDDTVQECGNFCFFKKSSKTVLSMKTRV